jgi:hypothetical protein
MIRHSIGEQEEAMSERDEREPQEKPGEPGPEDAASADRDTPPGLPSEEDDRPLGDTDQHSDAQA